MAAAFSFYLIPAAFCVSLVCGLTCLAPLSGTFGASQVSGNGRGGQRGGAEEGEAGRVPPAWHQRKPSGADVGQSQSRSDAEQPAG